ncbi:ECF-type sigma factor [Gemmata sp.]|uniref:ECF-type sigma factor n=1 Tax=Gemmata sp. TaxID=1914242 RepID=UPI003F71DED9
MSSEGSITRWIDGIRRGDENAAGGLWAAYFARMTAVAGQRLAGAGRGADDEDAALSAFKSFCLGARAGRFPELKDRDNLWPLLLALTSHKCVDHVRRETRLKRGGPDGPVAADLDLITSREPTPELLVEVGERLAALLDRLDRTGDPGLRTVATSKLEGYTAEEIAGRMGCARRTVERKIRVIEQVWDREEGDPAEGRP